MSTSHRSERCDTCRFWDPQTRACRRFPPVVRETPLRLSLARVGGVAAGATAGAAPMGEGEPVWPATPADAWCGEWAAVVETRIDEERPTGRCDQVAAHLFIGRLAPALEARDPTVFLEALLNQLAPDIRRVIVRMNGLDGQPLVGLREVAREFKMSQGQIRALLAAGEERLTDAIRRLGAFHAERR